MPKGLLHVFAGISTHDSEDYVFDLSQQEMNIAPEVYVEGEWKQDRHVSTLFCARSIRRIWQSFPGNL
jgi:hypothetical protein